MFDTVLISVVTHLKSESESGRCTLEVVSVINEKHGVVEVVFLFEFAQNQQCSVGRVGTV